jgi:hypothetical protein
MKNCDKLAQEVPPLTDLSIRSHRFAGVKFRLGAKRLDTFNHAESSPSSFPVPLVTRFSLPGLAEEDCSGLNPGWTTFQVRTAQSFGRALRLMKLSCVRYRLKAVTEPHPFLDRKVNHRGRIPRLSSCSGKFLPLRQALVSHAAVASAATM